MRHALTRSHGVGRAFVSTTRMVISRNTKFDMECVTPDFGPVVLEQSLARSKSSVPYRRQRIRSQVQGVLHDPLQRCEPSPTTAFRGSTVRLHHGRFWQKRLWHGRLRQWSFHHPLGEHRSPLNLLVDVCDTVEHDCNNIADGRRGARAGLVDVELVLGTNCEPCGVTSMVSTICSCIRSTTRGIS